MRLRQLGTKGVVVAVCMSEHKGERKKPVAAIQLNQNHGIVGDAHAGEWHRQVSLLARESIRKMEAKGLELSAGSFAENITTEGIALLSLKVGELLTVGDAVLEVTQIGKDCHNPGTIYSQAGDCVMPKEGVFAKVLRGGKVRPGETIQIMPSAEQR